MPRLTNFSIQGNYLCLVIDQLIQLLIVEKLNIL